MSKNKYVDFVSDEHFLKCVKWVCDSYPAKSNVVVDMKRLQKNKVDPFKMLFDISNGKISVDDWIKGEVIRQSDKTINNKIGDFHQKLLGGVKGWTDLGIGDGSKVDLKRNDGLIFMELKNKFNTVNSDSLNKVREKLVKAVKSNKKAISYWAYIISKDGLSEESDWNYLGDKNPKIRKVCGAKVYEIVTGDRKALEKMWKALPKAIKQIVGKGLLIQQKDMKKLVEFYQQAFH